jgi:capsular polysaccharide biosynthesis protein
VGTVLKDRDLAPGESTVDAYGAFLVRQRVVVAGGVLAGLVAALAILVAGPRTYSATTEVLVLGLVDEPADDGRSVAINLDDEAQILTSAAVARDAAARMPGRQTARDMIDATDATVPANTTILSITFRAPDPVSARDGAQAMGAAYLAQREALGRARLDAALAWLETERADVQRQLQDVTVRLGTAAESVTDQANRTALAGRLGGLRARLSAASASVPLGGRVVSDAALPARPRTPVPALVLVSGLLGGLLLGTGLGASREFLGPRILNADDLSRRFGLPVLTEVDAGPKAPQDITRLANLVISECDREAGAVRSYLIATTSPQSRDIAGPLVDALRRSGRPTTLERPEDQGRPALRPPHGPAPEGERAGGSQAGGVSLEERVEAARRRGEIVVIDAPATGTGRLAPLVADALVVVVDFGRTSPDALENALDRLHREHHVLTGIIGVRPPHGRRLRGRSPRD